MTILNSVIANYVILLCIALIFYKLVAKKSVVFIQNEHNESLHALDLSRQFTLNDVDIKVIKLSVNSFRTLLFVITSVAILAVDFEVFPSYYGKSAVYGFSLMDVGVGYFILCHSMRLIRNSTVLSDDLSSTTGSSFKKYNFIFWLNSFQTK